jgi:hypothetical protein
MNRHSLPALLPPHAELSVAKAYASERMMKKTTAMAM